MSQEQHTQIRRSKKRNVLTIIGIFIWTDICQISEQDSRNLPHWKKKKHPEGHTILSETNPNYYGVRNSLTDSNSIFVVAESFLNYSNFWCVPSSTTWTDTLHLNVLWPVCAQTTPWRMLLCLWRIMLTDVCINQRCCKKKTWNNCGRSKASVTEHRAKCLTC